MQSLFFLPEDVVNRLKFNRPRRKKILKHVTEPIANLLHIVWQPKIIPICVKKRDKTQNLNRLTTLRF